ncbi:MAG: Hint domain-containing protein [Pseudomonadota bacterium]
MSWLGLADARARRFSLRGIGSDRKGERRHPDTDGYVLPRGTLLFETRMMPEARPHVLLGYEHAWPEASSLSFHAVPGGGISVVQVTDRDVAHGAVKHVVDTRTQILRVTFSWDTPRNWARLTVERPETHAVTSRSIKGLGPMPLERLRALILGETGTQRDGDVVYVALSDQIEPTGPMPSLSANTMLETADGFRAADQIKRGDLLRTKAGDLVPVLYRVTRTVPSRGDFAPLRLRAPYFGLKEDVVAAAHQRLVIEGSEVEYLFNTDAVLVPARHLVNGFAARAEKAQPTVTYMQFILPRHETINAAGSNFESLYIGRIARHKDRLAASLLAQIEPATLPQHAMPVHKELHWYEAIHLARQRAA